MKEEIIERIKSIRAEIDNAESRLRLARSELAALAEYRVGDVVETTKGIRKLSRVSVDENTGAMQSYNVFGRKQRKDGTWFSSDTYIGGSIIRLVSRDQEF